MMPLTFIPGKPQCSNSRLCFRCGNGSSEMYKPPSSQDPWISRAGDTPGLCSSKFGLKTSSICITWKHEKCKFLIPMQSHWIRYPGCFLQRGPVPCLLAGPPGDTDAQWGWRTIAVRASEDCLWASEPAVTSFFRMVPVLLSQRMLWVWGRGWGENHRATSLLKWTIDLFYVSETTPLHVSCPERKLWRVSWGLVLTRIPCSHKPTSHPFSLLPESITILKSSAVAANLALLTLEK